MPHRRHCLVSLRKALFPLFSTGSTQEELSRKVAEKVSTGMQKIKTNRLLACNIWLDYNSK